MAAEDITGYGVIADTNVNVEDEAIHNIMLSNLRKARETLSSDEQLLLTLLYDEGQTMGEIAKALGVSQQAVSKKHSKIITKLNKILKIFGCRKSKKLPIKNSEGENIYFASLNLDNWIPNSEYIGDNRSDLKMRQDCLWG